MFVQVIEGRTSDPKALMAQVVWASVGLLTVFYLVYVELFLIGALCLWCTAIHAIVVSVLVAPNDVALAH